jgi:uncharacterized integral membrane protein
MRWVYLIAIVLFVAAIVLFGLQNLELVTVSFLTLSIRAPLALLTVVAYCLGMMTGASLLALVRRSVRGARAS